MLRRVAPDNQVPAACAALANRTDTEAGRAEITRLVEAFHLGLCVGDQPSFTAPKLNPAKNFGANAASFLLQNKNRVMHYRGTQPNSI